MRFVIIRLNMIMISVFSIISVIMIMLSLTMPKITHCTRAYKNLIIKTNTKKTIHKRTVMLMKFLIIRLNMIMFTSFIMAPVKMTMMTLIIEIDIQFGLPGKKLRNKTDLEITR